MKQLKKLKDTLSNKNSFLRHVLTITSGTVIAQVITVVSSPVLTRLYTPEEMGVLASLLAVVMIIGIVAAGRYDLAVVLPNDEQDANAVIYTGIIIAFIFSLLITIVFVFFGSRLGPLLGMKNVHKKWLDLIGLMVFLVGVEHVLKRSCVRDRNFKVIASAQVFQQVGANGVKIGAGFLHGGVAGLFIGTLSGHVIRTVKLVFAERGRLLKKNGTFDFTRIKKVAKRYKKFPLISSWSALLNTASSQIPVILFASLYSPSVAGHYALSHRILSLPMTLIGRSVSDVFIERSAKARENSFELSRLALSIYKKLILIGALCLSFVTFYGAILFPFIFGSNWVEAGRYAQWISVWLVFSLASSPLGMLFSVLERQGEGFIFDLLLFISRAGVIASGYFFALEDITTIAIFASVSAFLGFVKCVRCLMISYVPVKKIIFSTLLLILPIFSVQFILSLVIRGLLSSS